MNYYIKVALITLLISVAVAETAGPMFGVRGYIVPFVSGFFGDDSTADNSVASLELTSEKPKPKKAKAAKFSASQALDVCVSAIKQVSLHPDFTQVPAVSPVLENRQFKMVWDKKSPARTMNADGADIGLLATCHVDQSTGDIALFSINGRSLVNAAGEGGLTGGWKVERAVSEVDNSTNVTVTATAADAVTVDGESATPQLVLHCGEDKTIVYIGMGVPVGTGTIMVDAGIGDDSDSSRWSISTDRRNIFPDGQYIGLIRQMMASPQATFSLAPGGGETIEARFDLRGLAAAVFPLQEACHWK